jgi:hypothetical protein
MSDKDTKRITLSNGVLQIYPQAQQASKVMGKVVGETCPKPFIMGEENWEDRTDQWGETKDNDTIVTHSQNQERKNVKSYDELGEASSDHEECHERGYMCGPNDWYNVEQTAYWQITEAAGDEDDQEMVQYMNGWRHTDDDPPGQCTGCAYKGVINYENGQNRWRKEVRHNDYRDMNWKPGVSYSIAESERWVGMKTVRFEYPKDDGSYAIRLELWIDDDENNEPGSYSNKWRLLRVVEDFTGKEWDEDSDEGCGCGCPDIHEPLFFKYPFASYRTDNTEAEMAGVSVVEIIPPAPNNFYKQGDVLENTN